MLIAFKLKLVLACAAGLAGPLAVAPLLSEGGSPDGTMRESSRYLLVGREGAGRPDPVQAAWLFAQMVRWGQTSVSPEALRVAMAVTVP